MNKYAVVVLLIFFMGAQFGQPAMAEASVLPGQAQPVKETAATQDKYSVIGGDTLLANSSVIKSKNLGQKSGKARKIIKTLVTAYTSSVDETDSTPNITASGTFTRKGVAAANFLPIGTKIRLPKLFGGQVFTIEDRMNERYSDRVDIWFPTKENALNFGLRMSDIEIL